MPGPAFASFNGNIDTLVARRICDILGAANLDQIEHLHLSITSTGGNLIDALHIYQTMRAVSFPITVHAIGTVQSSGLALLLGGHHRVAAPEAWFMAHPVTLGVQEAFTAQRASDLAHQLRLLEDAMDDIFKSRTTLTDQDLVPRRHREIVWSAQQAKTAGLVHEVASFSLPAGVRLISVMP